MKKKKNGIWQTAMVFVGTVIGAGFASGAEIRTYFTRYGAAGFAGMAVAVALFIITAVGFLRLAQEERTESFEAAARLLAGEKAGAALDTVVTVFMLISLGVMIAGTGEVFMQQWGLPFWSGALLMGGLSLAALCRGSQGVLVVNTVLGPLLIAGILLLSFTTLRDAGHVNAQLSEEPVILITVGGRIPLGAALLSAIIYASYNMLGAGAVFTGLGRELARDRRAWRGALAGGAILGVLILAMGLATFLNYDTIEAVPVPALELLRGHHFQQNFYVTVLIGAMYTTAVSDGFGVLCRLRGLRPRWPAWMSSLLIVAAAFGVACLGFGRLIEKGYLIFGCIGLGQWGLLLYYYIKKKQNKPL